MWIACRAAKQALKPNHLTQAATELKWNLLTVTVPFRYAGVIYCINVVTAKSYSSVCVSHFLQNFVAGSLFFLKTV